ncbi:cyanamide hydratase [Plectosphaerella cucumerina]|uniref:Cyanamide hydratase n=1 Tax=Plectosphaerella cucumerina TaxID=40658 RepID=A0A8K0X0C2_9PEZI|nr:cyanamide hydratase [Plectosphaerella cucumerina]
MSPSDVKANGWTAVSVSAKAIIGSVGKLQEAGSPTVQDIKFPLEDPLVVEAQAFAKARLGQEAYNHSMRVFLGQAPSLQSACCPSTPRRFTRMSFDIYGGIKAMEVLKVLGGSADQAEAVAEAIIRHEDMGVDGTITFLGQLIQLATLYDNTGVYEGIDGFGSWVGESTRHSVNTAFPRRGWCSWFACTVRKEEANKPWCHTTHIPRFDKQLEGNTLMKPWE